MNPVDQPTANPTRKLSAAVIASAVLQVSGLIVRNLWPTYYDDAVWAALSPVVIFAVGYFVKDLPNG
jgi:predicted anti-sigma-YlaC factor YlaD